MHHYKGKRGRLEKYASILAAVQYDTLRPSHIMIRASLKHYDLESLLKNLTKMNMVTLGPDAVGINVSIAESGTNWLNLYRLLTYWMEGDPELQSV